MHCSTEFPTLVDCVWEKFGAWGQCSVTCGNGTKTRTREKSIQESNGGKPCDGNPTEEKTCNERECPGEYSFLTGICINYNIISGCDTDT